MIRFAGKRRFTLWTAAVLTVAVLCLLGAFILINSETAGRRLLQYAAGNAGVEIGGIAGSLSGGMILEDVDYSKDTLDIRIDKLVFDWEPWALLYGTAKFRSLRLDGVRIKYAPAKSATSEKTQLPDFSLPLRISLAATEVHDLQLDYAGHEFTLDQIHLDGALGSTLALTRLRLQAPLYRLSATGSIAGDFPYAAALTLQWEYHRADIELAGTAEIKGDIKLLELEHRLTAPVNLDTAGRIIPGLAAGTTPRVELHNRWNTVHAPFTPLPVTTTGKLDITGWLDDFRLQGSGEVKSERMPPFRFTLDADGDLAGLDATDLKLEMLQGTIAATGSVQWKPGFEWIADIAATGIDLGSFHPALPDNLQLDFHTEGARITEQWRGKLDHIRGTGSVRTHALKLSGELEFDNQSFSSPSLRLSIGENVLALNGSLNRRIDLHWDLHAPRLAALWPELQGAVTASGSIGGARNSPKLNATVSAEQLAYGDYRIERLTTGIQTEKSGHVLTLAAEQLMLRKRTLSSFTLDARGNAATHLIESRIQDDSLMATFIINGGYRNSRWQGQLREAAWKAANLPAWSLRQPVDMAIDAGSIRIEPACWSASDARICGQFAAARNGDIRGEASLSSVPAGLLDRWLSPHISFDGRIDGTLTVNGRNTDLAGSLELNATTGQIGVRREGMPTDFYRWENAFLKASLGDKAVTATAGLTFPGYGAAESAVSVNLQSRALDGDIAARFSNLAPLQTVVPDLDDLNGYLEAALDLDGTIDRPRLSGRLSLRDASTRISRSGIQLRNLRFDAHGSNGADISFKGTAESGFGRLELNGTLAYGAGTPALKASITGDQFEIMRLPHIQAHISPQLDIDARPRKIDIQGTVRIPHLQINIREPPESVVAVSEDVIIESAVPGAQPRNGFQFSSRVRLILGDEVRFQGFGFDTGLTGQLTLNKRPDRPVATTGELTVKQGQYKAYGQKLEIDRGQLLFQGAYDNPGLDILAVRKTDNVTVSLEIGGTLENPRSRIFSEPPLPDSEAMAILLTGKPLGSASRTDADALVNAIAGLGLRKGQFITDEIARTFNLDEFKIKTESDVTASSLLIGKQISPRLFIRYIVGLFDQTSRIGLSYELTRRLKLEAESGWNQSIDLIYEIER